MGCMLQCAWTPREKMLKILLSKRLRQSECAQIGSAEKHTELEKVVCTFGIQVTSFNVRSSNTNKSFFFLKIKIHPLLHAWTLSIKACKSEIKGLRLYWSASKSVFRWLLQVNKDLKDQPRISNSWVMGWYQGPDRSRSFISQIMKKKAKIKANPGYLMMIESTQRKFYHNRANSTSK